MVTYASPLRVRGAWLIMQIAHFNGPIAARATCKATRRQGASASDWPAQPPRGAKAELPTLRAAEKVQDK